MAMTRDEKLLAASEEFEGAPQMRAILAALKQAQWEAIEGNTFGEAERWLLGVLRQAAEHKADLDEAKQILTVLGFVEPGDPIPSEIVERIAALDKITGR